MGTAIDFAARLIDPQAIKSAGHSAVIAYVSPPRPGAEWMQAKPITKRYADQLGAAGVDVASVWQFGKPGNPAAPSDWTTGYEGGKRMAREADERHRAAGGPADRPIYFSVDEDISLQQWNQSAVHFFRGVNEVIGLARTGIYGHSRVCAWAIEDSVIGRTSEGKYWAWQTRAWSYGAREPAAVLFQRVIDTPSNPGPLIDGSSVDVNDILAADYGQWSISRDTRSGSGEVGEMAWTEDIKNYRGIPVDASFMLAWIDKRAALTERYMAAILDKLAGEGTAQRIKDEFEADLPGEFKG